MHWHRLYGISESDNPISLMFILRYGCESVRTRSMMIEGSHVGIHLEDVVYKDGEVRHGTRGETSTSAFHSTTFRTIFDAVHYSVDRILYVNNYPYSSH